MADPSRASQFEIQAIERSALPGGKILVRIRGRWRGRQRPETEGVLVVDQRGREYRFFANPPPRRGLFARPGTWIGSFALPASLALDASGELSLHFGRITIPLPSFAGEMRAAQRGATAGQSAPEEEQFEATGTEDAAVPPPEPVAVPPPEPETDEPVTEEHAAIGGANQEAAAMPPPGAAEPGAGDAVPAESAAADAGAGDAGVAESAAADAGVREPPAADVGAAEPAAPTARAADHTADGAGAGVGAGSTIGATRSEAATLEALRTELERRAGNEATLRGRLADVEADLRARAALLAKLEPTFQELREAQSELRELIEQRLARETELESLRQRLEQELSAEREETARLRAALASDEVARQAAVSEASAMRSEVERLASDLAAAREQLVAHDPDLAEAQAMLAEARELRARLVGNGRSDS